MVVTLLALLALSIHADCPAALVGSPVTHWATVPSLPAQPGEHPIHGVVRGLTPGLEIPLAAASQAARPREVDSAHFSTAMQVRPGSHALLIDDSWPAGVTSSQAVEGYHRGVVDLKELARWHGLDPGQLLGEIGPPRDVPADDSTATRGRDLDEDLPLFPAGSGGTPG